MFAPKEGQEVASVSDDHTCRYVFCSRHHWNSSTGFLCVYLHACLIFFFISCFLHSFNFYWAFILKGKISLINCIMGVFVWFLCFGFFFTCLFSKQYFELNKWMRRKLFCLGIMEKIILRVIEKHLKDSAVINHSQHEVHKGKSFNSFSWQSYLPNLPGEADCPNHFGFLQSFGNCFSESLSGQNVQYAATQKCNAVDEQLAEGLKG